MVYQEEDGEGNENGDGEGDLVVREVEDEHGEEGDEEARHYQIASEE